MSDIVLLGAGASRSCGISTAYQLTVDILDRARNGTSTEPRSTPRVKAIELAIGLCKIAGANQWGEVDFEALMNTLLFLRDRATGSYAPYAGLQLGVLKRAFEGKRFLFPFSREVRIVNEARNLGKNYPAGTTSTPVATDDALEYSLGKLVTWIQKVVGEKMWLLDTSKIDYLKPLLTNPPCDPFVIATLNYDNSIERTSESSGVQVQLGVEDWDRNGRFPDIQSGIWLLKLHGSVTWARETDLNAPGNISVPQYTFGSTQVIPNQTADKIQEIGIIAGGINKLTGEGPFLALMARFEETLNRADQLTVIGYSFRDTHINDLIIKWFNRNPGATLRVVNGPDFDLPSGQHVSVLNNDPNRFINTRQKAEQGIQSLF